MKIVFSRKGFDAKYGGKPSPIFPDGTALSLPIPYPGSPTRFNDVRWRNTSLGQIVECLTNGEVKGRDRCHLDPDLNANALVRSPGWLAAFGQAETAQRHLKNQGVGPGDLFLFFGWFRAAEPAKGGTWQYASNAPDVHRLFGWLQVAEVVTVGTDTAGARTVRPWLSDHPHVNPLHPNGRSWPPNNTVYVATRTLNIGGTETRTNGGGLFSGANDRVMLTAPGASSRSYWRLPRWFCRVDGQPMLSYHRKKQWQCDGPWAYVKSASPGQEFVFNADGIPEADTWLHSLFDT